MIGPTMPWSATFAVVDTDEAPPDPPVWRQGESLEAYERALRRWIREMLEWARRHHRHHHRAVGIQLRVGGEMGQVSISVDAQGEKAVAEFVDDKGDVTPTPPNGPDGAAASIAYASSDTSVVDVGADGSLTLNKAGSASITATAVDSTGAPLANFPAASVDVTLNPGAAAGLEVTVQP